MIKLNLFQSWLLNRYIGGLVPGELVAHRAGLVGWISALSTPLPAPRRHQQPTTEW